jgi:peroxiredoxin
LGAAAFWGAAFWGAALGEAVGLAPWPPGRGPAGAWPGRLAGGRAPDLGRGGVRFFLLAIAQRVVPRSPTIEVMLSAGDKAPSFTLPAVGDGREVADPWAEGETVVAFFKVTCPVCKMVAPLLTKMAEAGVRVVAVGEDPPEAIAAYNEAHGQRVPALSQPAPYRVSAAYGLEAVPSIFLVAADGEILRAVPGWGRDTWNELAATAGVAEPLSTPDDGLRPFRPG